MQRARASLAALACAAAAVCPPSAAALIAPSSTLDGPSSQIGEVGGAAVAADGGGGIVYIKNAGGVPHVFAALYTNGRWQPPVRVDWQNPYGASFARIAAADGGRLVVVWVTQLTTAGGKAVDALYGSTLGPGGSSFGEQIVIDPDLAEGEGVDPSLALATDGQGYVAYRAVTNNGATTNASTIVPRLHPGDVLADIRVARYEGGWWSSPERVNRDPLVSMRPPTTANGPQIGVGNSDEAVVAWQEPESDGVARIWARRVFGGSLGLAMQASPTTFEGQPVTAEADAFALSVSELGEAKIVSRVDGVPGTPLARPRMFASTLPVSTAFSAAKLTSPLELGGGAQGAGGGGQGSAGGLGVPSVSVDDAGAFRVAFAAGATASVLTGDEQHEAAPEVPLGAPLSGVGVAATTLNPAGGGVTAWPARASDGRLGVAVREDYRGGAAQSALISGAIDGPISELALGGSESGESLVGFREGDPGEYEIVGARVSAPPPPLYVSAAPGWVSPAHALVSWSEAEDAVGGVSYSLVIDGHVVQRGIHGLSVVPRRRLLGSGVRHVQILATDASGQQTLSGETDLKVDGSPPVARVRRLGRRTVVVRVEDRQSGAVAQDTRIGFGDGARVKGRLKARHSYARPGRYVIAVAMRDSVGNATVAHLRVSVR
jgi:hypothetical protein